MVSMVILISWNYRHKLENKMKNKSYFMTFMLFIQNTDWCRDSNRICLYQFFIRQMYYTDKFIFKLSVKEVCHLKGGITLSIIIFKNYFQKR